MACAKALAKTLTGTPTEVSYGAMPVAIKTSLCPTVVSPPARDAKGKWEIEGEGHNIKALFKNNAGDTLGMALTGDKITEKAAIAKTLPNIMA